MVELQIEDEQDEEKEVGETLDQKNEALLKAAKDNDYDTVDLYLTKLALATYEKDGWNPLLWASCNGNEDIVRLLIRASAHNPYIQS